MSETSNTEIVDMIGRYRLGYGEGGRVEIVSPLLASTIEIDRERARRALGQVVDNVEPSELAFHPVRREERKR